MAVSLRASTDEEVYQASAIQRSPEQLKARIENAKERLQPGKVGPGRSFSTVRIPTLSRANDNPSRAQERVQRLRSQNQAQQVQVPVPQKSSLDYLGYIPAFAIAICKDLLDFIGIGSLPLIGWLVTAMASFLIFVALMATDSSVSMNSSRRILTRIGILSGSVLVEGVLFGINLFPLETAAVALILLLDMKGDILQKVSRVIRYTPIGRATKGMVK